MQAADDHGSRLDRALALWRNPQVRYPLLVVLYLALMGWAFNASLETLRGPLASAVRGTAGLVHYTLLPFTELTTLRGNVVTYDGFAVAIIIECLGLFEMVIYSACVVAFPAPIRSRVIGVLLGCLVILAFNLVRIIMLLLVGRFWNESFDFFHLYFWQATLIAIIVSVLYGWIRIFVPR